MGRRQLNIRSDEAHAIACGLSSRLGLTTTEVVVEALRSLEQSIAPRDEKGLTPEQRRRYDAVMALTDEMAKRRIPNAPEGHDWLYDEDGLPT